MTGKDTPLLSVLDAHLSVGGIPEYLRYLRLASSPFLGVLENSFQKGGYFVSEHDRVFVSSLARNEKYREIVNFLSLHRFADRSTIGRAVGLEPGGGLTELLKDLEICHFIESYRTFDSGPKSKLQRYAISDYFLQFFGKFIGPQLREISEGYFSTDTRRAIEMSTYRQWLGYAFERFCRHQAPRIADALGFGAVRYRSGSYFSTRRAEVPKGFQIDLLFERADRVMTICGIKYTGAKTDSSVIEECEEKIRYLPNPKGYSIERVLISPTGASDALQGRAYFDRVLSVDLFLS